MTNETTTTEPLRAALRSLGSEDASTGPRTPYGTNLGLPLPSSGLV